MRVVLTQSAGKLEDLATSLRARGFEVVRNPLVRTEPLLTCDVRRVALELLACPWILFTSPAAVAAWWALELLAAHPVSGEKSATSAAKTPLVGAVGQKTAAAIRRYGGRVDLTATPENAGGLAQSFLTDARKASPVGLPCGDRALPTLKTRLEQCGVTTRSLVIYQTETLEWSVRLAAGVPDTVVLSSPSAVEALPEAVGMSARLVALGPSTGAAVRARGWCYVEAAQPNSEAVIAALNTLSGSLKHAKVHL